MPILKEKFADEDLSILCAEASRFDSLTHSVESIMNSDDLRDNKIYKLRQMGLSLQSIGDRFGKISRERVRQIYNDCKDRLEKGQSLNSPKTRKPRMTEDQRFIRELKITPRAMNFMCWLSDNIKPNDKGQKIFDWNSADLYCEESIETITDVVMKGLFVRKLIFIVDSKSKTYHRDHNATFAITEDGDKAAKLRELY